MTEQITNFGEWLRYWRENLDLTQDELGERVGVKKQHISNLERGEKNTTSGKAVRPSYDLTVKLAKVFNRPLAEAVALAGYSSEAVSDETALLSLYRDLPDNLRQMLLAIAKTLHAQSGGIGNGTQPPQTGGIGDTLKMIGIGQSDVKN